MEAGKIERSAEPKASAVLLVHRNKSRGAWTGFVAWLSGSHKDRNFSAVFRNFSAVSGNVGSQRGVRRSGMKKG